MKRSIWFCLFFAAVMSMIASHAWCSDKFVFIREGNVWVANSDGTAEQQLTTGGEASAPALSPDGRSVVFHAGHDERTGYGQLLMVPAAGGKPQKLQFPGIEGAEHAAFSPDGGRLLFVGLSASRTRGTGDAAATYATMSILIADVTTRKPRTVVRTSNVMLDAGYVYTAPSFSPDGMLIAYQESGSDVSGGFVVVDLKGRRLFRYPKKASDPAPYWRPRFSSDGKSILCYSPATSESTTDIIYLVDPATGARKKVTEGSYGTFVEHGKAIIFERWLNRWSDGARAALFYLGLSSGAQPKRILVDASEPSG